MRITKDVDLEKVIDLFPETLQALYAIGFTELETPPMRHAAKLVSVGEAAALMGADPDHLVDELNRIIQGD